MGAWEIKKLLRDFQGWKGVFFKKLSGPSFSWKRV